MKTLIKKHRNVYYFIFFSDETHAVALHVFPNTISYE